MQFSARQAFAMTMTASPSCRQHLTERGCVVLDQPQHVGTRRRDRICSSDYSSRSCCGWASPQPRSGASDHRTRPDRNRGWRVSAWERCVDCLLSLHEPPSQSGAKDDRTPNASRGRWSQEMRASVWSAVGFSAALGPKHSPVRQADFVNGPRPPLHFAAGLAAAPETNAT